MDYYLLDLERTIGSDIVHYWKANKRGYTRHLNEAGKYPEDEAQQITEADLDKTTVMISEDTVKKITKFINKKGENQC